MTERDVLALADMAQKCALYDFDSVEMVECKWADWNDIINALRRAAAPTASVREALDQTVKFDECESPEPTLRQIIRQYYIQGLQPDANLAIKLSERYIAALSAAPVERGREEIARAICDGFTEGNEDYENIDSTLRIRFLFAADAVLALLPLPAGNVPYCTCPCSCDETLHDGSKCALHDTVTDWEDVENHVEARRAGNMDKPTTPLPLPSEQRLSTEAVAWRWRPSKFNAWHYVPHKPTLSVKTAECEPLYAHPPADRDAVVEELTAERDRLAKRLDLLAVGFGVPDGGKYIADWQTRIAKYKASQEAYTDDEGNVWSPPTAWAYFAACRALNEKTPKLAYAEERLAGAESALVKARERIDELIDLINAGKRVATRINGKFVIDRDKVKAFLGLTTLEKPDAT